MSMGGLPVSEEKERRSGWGGGGRDVGLGGIGADIVKMVIPAILHTIFVCLILYA